MQMLEEEEGAMLATSALYKRDLVLKLRKVQLAAQLPIAVKHRCCCSLTPFLVTLDRCVIYLFAQPTDTTKKCQRDNSLKMATQNMTLCITLSMVDLKAY